LSATYTARAYTSQAYSSVASKPTVVWPR